MKEVFTFGKNLGKCRKARTFYAVLGEVAL